MRKRILFLFVAAALLIAAGVSLQLLRPRILALFSERLRQSLSEEFESPVQFEDFHVALFPRPHATVTGLVLRHRGRTDVPPLLQVAELSLGMGWRGLTNPPLRIKYVHLKGLQITLPPREPGQRKSSDEQQRNVSRRRYSVRIDQLDADDAQIILLRAQPEKPPLRYRVHRLQLTDMSFDQPAQFDATLTNAVPRGEIYVNGTFGPWDSDTPRATPIQASYRFDDADLSTIKGLSGMLRSRGVFAGPLDELQVKGTTITPDFTLRRVANPVNLRTEFSAIVDGTTGNTYLRSIQAHFEHSKLSVRGEVVDRDAAIRGRTINLDVESSDARAEDLIHLAVKTDRPVVSGPVTLHARIRIPEEDKDLSERLDVYADFELTDGHFSNPNVQDKVDLLSRKGLGEPKNLEIAHVPAVLQATMHCQKSLLTFPKIDFAVPGAHLELQGEYALGGGDLDFNGNLLLDVKLSQTTTGPRSLVLKAVDPFFRAKDGGAKIPVRVQGTKDHPTFALGHGKGAKQATSSGAPQSVKSD